MTKLKFNHMLALASTMALMSGSQTVYAQTQPAASEVEEVVVTGFRRSIQNSLAAKQESTSVVEAVYAEDIGKLPDTSIAESLARLPGLAGERRDGRTSGIAVRGFNENYVATTMNGRELLGIGDNRGVEYDLYPSEIISGAVVHKTMDATVISQGLGGTVDLKTIRPLDTDRIISINGSYEQNGLKSENPDFDDNGHRLAFTYSDKFADDTIGAAISIASMESPSQEEQFRAWGYDDVDGDGPLTERILAGQDSYFRSSLMKRDTFAGVVQFAPNDQLKITADALYIDFNDSKVFRGLEEGIRWGSTYDYDPADVVDDLVLASPTTGFHSVVRNDGEEKDADLTEFGLNVEYQITDAWSLGLDLATGSSSKDLLNMESYSGTGRGGVADRPANDRSFVMTSKGAMFTLGEDAPDLTNPALIYLAGPQTWGGDISPAFNGRNDQQDGFINNPSFEEDLDTLKLSAKGEIEFSIVKGVEFGINYSDRTKSKVNYGAFLTANDYFTEEGLAHNLTVTNPYSADDIDGGASHVPDEYIVGTTDLSFLGLGSILAYDGIQLYKDGFYRELPASLYQTDRLGDTYEVSEQVTTLFGKLDIETGIMTGNVGLQIVDTSQESKGYSTYSTKETIDGEDYIYALATPVKGGADYVKLLPSLNLNFQITDDQVLRFAAAKTSSRPRMDDMRANSRVGFNFNPAFVQSNELDSSPWSATAGNPELKPLEAIQFDLSYEYYYADDGYVSAAYFYKDLQTWHADNPVLTDFTDYYLEDYHNPDGDLVLYEGFTTTKAEIGNGNVQGTELQASVPFHLFSEALDGFGIIASATFLDGELVLDGGSTSLIPGLSKESYQFTAYYEKAGFEARISGRKRDEFLTEFYGLSLALTPTVDLGSELWDAQIGYNFSESNIAALDGLTVTLQAQNLTDEDTISADERDPRKINKYQHFGANYLLGFNYKF